MDIRNILDLSRNCKFEEVRKAYKSYPKDGIYNKSQIRSAYKSYCASNEYEVKNFYYKKRNVFLKVLLGAWAAAIPLYMTYLEGFQSKLQFILILFCSLYLFCSGWGVEVLTGIKFQTINKIPIIGTSLYIILKLGIGTSIGGIVVLLKTIKWISQKTR